MKRGLVIAGVSLAILGLIVGRAARTHSPPVRVSESYSLGISTNEEPSADPFGGVKVRIFEDIVRSKNDNDPRLDREFRDLSVDARNRFRKKYLEIPREERNALGTIIYILGKNLRTSRDWRFLAEVAAEPRCLSMVNCGRRLK